MINILLVEDNEDNRDMLSLRLERNGFVVMLHMQCWVIEKMLLQQVVMITILNRLIFNVYSKKLRN